MVTTGAVTVMQKNMIYFANINEKLYYKVVPEHIGRHLASWIIVSDIVSSAAFLRPTEFSLALSTSIFSSELPMTSSLSVGV